ncbi:MAG: ThiF family adenylyltransferase, partial [Arcobacteraceae bacterium]
MKYSRSKKLFGSDFEKLQDAKIILLGVGGIGSFALDGLYRTGVTNITIVDFDVYEESNLNRQLGSETPGAIGSVKVDHLKTLYPNVTAINTKVTQEWLDSFDMSSYDYILDAIDDIPMKVELIKKYHKKLISTTGGAKRFDPTKIEYINIFKTYNDPFARKIRDMLKKDRFRKSFKVIFS